MFKSEPLIVIGFAATALLATIAVVFHLTGTPFSALKDTIAIVTPLLSMWVARSMVTPTTTSGEAPKVPPMPLLLFVIVMMLAAAGCTPAALQQTNGYIKLGDVGCEILLSATDPALAPFCATAAEVADAIAQLVAEQAGVVPTTAATVPFKPSRDAIYTRVKSNRIKKAMVK